MSELLPLALFFAKPAQLQPKLSPGGKCMAYLGRDETGILNLWLRPDLSRLDGAVDRQITFYTDFDACSLFRFVDERYIVFLRMTDHGSELYHLYKLDLDKLPDPESTAGQPREGNPGTRFGMMDHVHDMISSPQTTCGLGFVGNVQLWSNKQVPENIWVSTGVSDITLVHVD